MHLRRRRYHEKLSLSSWIVSYMYTLTREGILYFFCIFILFECGSALPSNWARLLGLDTRETTANQNSTVFYHKRKSRSPCRVQKFEFNCSLFNAKLNKHNKYISRNPKDQPSNQIEGMCFSTKYLMLFLLLSFQVLRTVFVVRLLL